MPEKDEFTFDDQDDLAGTDLSSAFAESEQVAEPPKDQKPDSGGGNRTRMLLLVLLLVLLCGAGAYYFMDLGGTTPEVAKPPEQSKQTVALPPQPTAVVPAPAPPEEPPVVSQTEPSAALPVPGQVEAPPAAVVAADPAPVASAVVLPPPPATADETKPVVEATPVVEAEPASAEKPAPVEKAEPVAASPSPAPATTAGGPYQLDAGSYLMASSRDAVKAKVSKFGYKPMVEPVKASVKMIRLRLGSFPDNEVAAALAAARSLSPDAFSLRQGDEHVVYAGSFLNSSNAESLKDQLTREGVSVVEEPVEIERTLSRIRFGGFADKASAEAVATKARAAGIPVNIIKNK